MSCRSVTAISLNWKIYQQFTCPSMDRTDKWTLHLLHCLAIAIQLEKSSRESYHQCRSAGRYIHSLQAHWWIWQTKLQYFMCVSFCLTNVIQLEIHWFWKRCTNILNCTELIFFLLDRVCNHDLITNSEFRCTICQQNVQNDYFHLNKVAFEKQMIPPGFEPWPCFWFTISLTRA